MALTPDRAVANIGTSSTTVFTVTNTAGKYAILKSLVIANISGSDATVHVALVASGGTEGDTNRFMKTVTIPANSTQFIDLNMVLKQNESLRATASVASAINIVASWVAN